MNQYHWWILWLGEGEDEFWSMINRNSKESHNKRLWESFTRIQLSKTATCRWGFRFWLSLFVIVSSAIKGSCKQWTRPNCQKNDFSWCRRACDKTFWIQKQTNKSSPKIKPFTSYHQTSEIWPWESMYSSWSYAIYEGKIMHPWVQGLNLRRWLVWASATKHGSKSKVISKCPSC